MLADEGLIDPQADRRYRRLLRRRPLARSRRAAQPHGPARTAPWCPGRARTASRWRSRPRPRSSPGATSPIRSSPTAARSTTSSTRPYTGRFGGDEGVAGQRPLLLGPRGPRASTLPRAAIRRRSDRLAQPPARGGEPYDGDSVAAADPERDHRQPLRLLHRRQRRPGAAAARQRLHRRPLPGRRDGSLLQPHPGEPSRCQGRPVRGRDRRSPPQPVQGRTPARRSRIASTAGSITT